MFHGGKPLCQPKIIGERVVKEGSCEYEEKLQFDIKVGDIPRMARICFAVYEVCKSVKNLRAKRLRDAYNHVCRHIRLSYHYYARPCL